jgi:hypothetical protein
MSSIQAFVIAHQAVCAGLGVAVIDLIMALVPGLQSNGILHWVYGMLVGMDKPPAA